MHHLVYVTTNIENGKFYIGKHSTANLNDNYCGSGVWVLRAKKAKRKLFTRVVKSCQTEEEAYRQEYEIIVNAKVCWPDLCMNISDGGVGFSTSYPLVRTGELAPMYGKKHTEEVKKQIAKTMSYRAGENHHMYGKNHDEDTRKKMSESHLKIGHLRGKKVKCLTNNVVYGSLAEAARNVAINSKARNNIRVAIKKNSVAYGHKWSFIEE